MRIIGEAIGRPTRFEEIAPELGREQLLAKGWPAPTVEAVTGTRARPFHEWALHHAADFR